jgi:serralysin
VFGDAGDDWISGDRGVDTMTGGAGADIFHIFADAGFDVVTDFSASQGDRVFLLAGTQYTVRQDGGDTIVDLGADGRLTLTGVQMGSLPQGWIFGA